MLNPAAPGDPSKGCPGALLFLVGSLAAFAAGCDRPAPEPGPTVLELDGGSIELGPGVALADVLLRSARMPAVGPDTLRIRAGDVVRFIASDDRPHAVVFEAERLTSEARAFLDRTHQLRSPPLIHQGATWILSFTDAPPGAYPYVDLSQEVRGVIVIAAPARPADRPPDRRRGSR